MYNPLHTATEHNCHAWIMYAHISRWHGLGFIVSFSSPLLHWPVTILFARTFSSFPNAFSADVATTVMVLTGWYAIHSFTTAADAFECDKERCVTDNTASPFCSLEPTNYFYGSGLGYPILIILPQIQRGTSDHCPVNYQTCAESTTDGCILHLQRGWLHLLLRSDNINHRDEWDSEGVEELSQRQTSSIFFILLMKFFSNRLIIY